MTFASLIASPWHLVVRAIAPFCWRFMYASGAWRYHRNFATGDRRAVTDLSRVTLTDLLALDLAWLEAASGRSWVEAPMSHIQTRR